ncbi:MAG TPA: adenylate/guanylate cyclase domain-containing protein [Actinomycetota bacterium]|nr:adenylate/guanylate cyclase domain-containing protein [Actinomycetota bacterium]
MALTFLLTDVEGSTRLWEEFPEATAKALEEHDRICAEIVARHGGEVIKPRGEGDSIFAVFSQSRPALAAAVDLQLALHSHDWPTPRPIKVRIGVHAGLASQRLADFYGPVVNRAARLRAAAHGGQVVVSEEVHAAVAGVPPSGAVFTDLGVHRLKDLSRPERIWQLGSERLPSSFPRLATLDPRGHNLPIQLTSFIGRSAELAAIVASLRENRLVTLTGPGGSGKTRLSLQAAAELSGDFADGLWLIELSPVSDPEAVVQRVASVLKVQEEPGRPLLETLAEAIQDKRLLLVFDNCEHVIGAAAKVAERLLMSVADLKVLATSREPLRIWGEATMPVPAMEVVQPPSEAEAAASEAVQLFSERAALVDPSWTLASGNVATIASICRTLDCLPLAIELAAARTRSLSLQEIESRLCDRFSLLSSGSRTAEPRQASLAGAVQWSYELLSEFEQEVFRRFAVFPGGATQQALEAVCLREDTADLVASLVDKSLVRAQEQPDGHTRYRMLDTIREFAQARLGESGSSAEAWAAQRSWLMTLVDPPEGTPCPTREARLDALAPEVDNLRAALNRSEGADAVVLAGRTNWVFDAFGTFAERSRLLERALSQSVEPTVERVDVLVQASGVARFLGDIPAARRFASEAAEQSTQLADWVGLVSALDEAGSVELFSGDRRRAVEIFGQALSLADEHDVPTGMIFCHLAEALMLLGRLEEARVALDDAAAKTDRDSWVGGYVQQIRAAVAIAEGDFDTASGLLPASIEIARVQRSPRSLALALADLATAAGASGRFDEAEKAADEAVGICTRINDDYWRARALTVRAALRVAQSRPSEARAEWGSIKELRGGRVEMRIRLTYWSGLFKLAGGDASTAARLGGAAEALVASTELQTDWPGVLSRMQAPLRSALPGGEAERQWAEGMKVPLQELLGFDPD